MKNYEILILLLLISACNQPTADLKEQRSVWGFEKWEPNFKDRALCLCLVEGYENEEIKNYILENDLSYYNAIGIAIFDPTLKPIIAKEVERIAQDSIELIDRVPEHFVGKKIFNHCMEFYKSERLDSIIKKEVPKWNDIMDIEAEIYKYLPTY